MQRSWFLLIWVFFKSNLDLIVFSDQTVKFYFLVFHIKSQIIAAFPGITYNIIYESIVILIKFVCLKTLHWFYDHLFYLTVARRVNGFNWNL